MTAAANSLIDGLDDEQRALLLFDFADEVERRSWAYFPRDHHGIPLHRLDVKQRKLVHALIASGLSLGGHAKVAAVMALETVLDRIEGYRLTAARDPERYFSSVFGTPGNSDPWGWRLEGHHVALSFTIEGDHVSSTPIFLGANPAEVTHGDHTVLRPCGEEEDVARDLLLSLAPEQRRQAIIAEVAPPDFVLANLPHVPATADAGDAVPPFMMRVPEIKAAWEQLPAEARAGLRFERAAPLGLPAAAMDGSQRDLLATLVRVYVERLADDLAAAEMDTVVREGLEGISFAWAGPAECREGHYYRLQSPSFLVEYDNTQDGANHVHAVWRDPGGDFGDALRQHLSAEH